MTLRERTVHRLKVVPRRLTAQEIALSGVMAAVMAVAAFIPVTVVAGVGKVISAAVMLEPLIGVFLGPVLGTYAAAAGAFVGQILAPHGAIFGLLTFIPPTVGAATAGLLAYKHWKAASGLMIMILLLWYSTSIGRELYYYPYMPVIFLGLAVLFRGHLGEWIHIKYNEIVGFAKAGTRIMVIGLVLIAAAQIVLGILVKELFIFGIFSLAVAAVLLLAYSLNENSLFKKGSAVVFPLGGIILFSGLAHSGFFMFLTAILACITCFLLALVLYERELFNNAFLFSFVAAGISAGILMVTHEFEGDFSYVVLQRISYALVCVGVFLFSIVTLQSRVSIKRWSGLALFSGGITGLVQQFLFLSSDSQVIRRELLGLSELPFSTALLGKKIAISTVLEYYVTKVFPVYLNHVGWLLIFMALIILGISFLFNISLEKLAIAYFIISGVAVLSDLMIGNFLAIQVLELKAAMFKAFLFIYPVERMFMALFATIFGVGVLIPLKKFGLNNMIRR